MTVISMKSRYLPSNLSDNGYHLIFIDEFLKPIGESEDS